MRRFILGWKQLGHEQRLKAKVVNYADDFVILCASTGQRAYEAMEKMMAQLKLDINHEKTRVCRVPEQSFDFLGYTLGRCYSAKTGRTYIGTWPSRKKIVGIKERISRKTDRCTLKDETDDKVAELNMLLRGWGNYFALAQCPKPTGEWTATPATGCVSGCARSTKGNVVAPLPIPTSIFMVLLG